MTLGLFRTGNDVALFLPITNYQDEVRSCLFRHIAILIVESPHPQPLPPKKAVCKQELEMSSFYSMCAHLQSTFQCPSAVSSSLCCMSLHVSKMFSSTDIVCRLLGLEILLIGRKKNQIQNLNLSHSLLEVSCLKVIVVLSMQESKL